MNSEENEAEKLPDGWILCQSKSSPGRRYFFHPKTGKSSWTQPQAEDDPEQKKQKAKKEKIGIREKRKKFETQKKNLKRKGDEEEDALSYKKQRPESTPDSFTSPSPTKPTTPAKYPEPKPILKDTTLKPILTKNSANTRLSQLRARLSSEASSDEVDSPSNRYNAIPRTPAPFEQKTVRFDLKTPPINEFKCPIRSPSSDSLYSTPSTSQFFAANKIISSMKAHLPEQFRNFRPRDTFAEIEDGIYNHTADQPFEMKHPSTPPQFSEASKLVSAIKSKLAYTPPEHRDERMRSFMQNRESNDQIGNFMSMRHTGFRMNSCFPLQSQMTHKTVEQRYQQKEFMGTRHDQLRNVIPTNEQTSCGITALPTNIPTFRRPDPRQDKMRAFISNVRQLNNVENNKQRTSLPAVEHINYSEYKARNCAQNKNVNNQNNQQTNQITDTLRTHVPNRQNIEENLKTRLAFRQAFEEKERIRSQNPPARLEDKPKTPYTPVNQDRFGPRPRNSIQNRLRIGENTSASIPNHVQSPDRLRSNNTSNSEHTPEKLKSCLVNQVRVEDKARSYPPIRQQIEESKLKSSIEATQTTPKRPLTHNKVQIRERLKAQEALVQALKPPVLKAQQNKESPKVVIPCKQTVEPKIAIQTPARVKPSASIEEELEKMDQKTIPQTQNIVNHKKEEVQSLNSNHVAIAETNNVPAIQKQAQTIVSESIKQKSFPSTLTQNQELVNNKNEDVKPSDPPKELFCTNTVSESHKLEDVVINAPSKVISLVPYCASPELVDENMDSDEGSSSQNQDLNLSKPVEPSNKINATISHQDLIEQLSSKEDSKEISKPQIRQEIIHESVSNVAQNQGYSHSQNQEQVEMKFAPCSPKSGNGVKTTIIDDTIIIELDSDSDSLEDVETFSSAKDRMDSLRNRLSKEAKELTEITDEEYLSTIKLPSPDLNVITDEEYLKTIELPKCPSEGEAMEVDCRVEDTEPPSSEVNSSYSCLNESNMDPNADIVLVVDTNIFIHELDVIRNVLNSHIKGYIQQPTLLVPWRVITELDRLKDNNNGTGAICKRARAAMDYLYKSLPENNRIKGQSLRDSNSHIYPCETPDDEILNCCLQQKERGKSVILLSNDKNLCNKAVINGIRCIDATDELKNLLESKPQAKPDPDLWETVRHCEGVMYQLLANILESEMRAKYNNLWQHVIFKAPPWSLRDVLQCLLKHWIAVFDEVFPRIEHLITDLKNTVTCIENKDLKALTQSDVANFKDLCLEIANKCLIIPEYMELAKATVERLQRKPCEELTEMAVIEAFERLWIVFSSYCVQLCRAVGLHCTLEDKLGTNMSPQQLNEKWPVYSAQLYALTLAIKGSLCLNEAELSDEQVDELEDVFKESLAFVQTDSSRVNKNNLRMFCTKCRNMLQEASTKFTGLTDLLNVCKQRMDHMLCN